MLAEGEQVIYGRSRYVGRDGVTLGTDHNLRPGHQCKLAIMLPKDDPNEAMKVVQGRGEVVTSVQSEAQFQITVKWLELDEYCNRLLGEQLDKVKKR